MTAPGSFAEGQEFFASGTKPPRRFWDRARLRRMTENGVEMRLTAFDR